jgi:hypothetical protein
MKEKANIETGKCYKQKSEAFGNFRYIKVESQNIETEYGDLIFGESVSAGGIYIKEGHYYNSGSTWEEISVDSFEEIKKTSKGYDGSI